MVEVMHENCSLKLYNIEFQDVQSDKKAIRVIPKICERNDADRSFL